MDLNLLATLKDKLLHAKNFSEVWHYFFDHFGEDAEFIALGERIRDTFLEAVLDQVAQQIFGKKVPVHEMLLTRLAEHQFIHGGCIINGKLANVVYFEDVQVGLFALIMSVQPSDTRMARFSGRAMPARGSPSAN